MQRELARRTLTLEQEKALKHILNPHGSTKMVSGLAGTGKTYLLDTAREVWQKTGYQVMGTAFTGKAAEGLALGANLESRTLHNLLWSLEHQHITLDARTVVVVDEAGMINTRQLAQLMEKTVASGCKLILVGDHRQLQPIGAGGSKQKLMELLGYTELRNITRQQEEWARQAVKDIADGKVASALQAHVEKGLVKVAAQSGTASEELIQDWALKGIKRPKEHLILASYRDDVFILNCKAQSCRSEAGLLKPDNLMVAGQKFYGNDRILFTRNCRSTGVKNGQFATIKRIKGAKLTVMLDNGRQKTINTQTYHHIQLGYASTTHKAQGETRGHVYVLLGGAMQDLELSYVQFSRAKYQTRFYVEPSENRQETLTQLLADMKRSRQKQMAVTYEQDNLESLEL